MHHRYLHQATTVVATNGTLTQTITATTFMVSAVNITTQIPKPVTALKTKLDVTGIIGIVVVTPRKDMVDMIENTAASPVNGCQKTGDAGTKDQVVANTTILILKYAIAAKTE